MRKTLHGVALPKGVPNTMLTDADASKNNVSVSHIRFVNCTLGGVSLAESFHDGASWNITKGKSVHAITVDGTPIDELIYGQ